MENTTFIQKLRRHREAGLIDVDPVYYVHAFGIHDKEFFNFR